MYFYQRYIIVFTISGTFMAQFRKCYLEMLNQNQQNHTTEIYGYRQNTFVTMVLIYVLSRKLQDDPITYFAFS